MGTFVLEEGSRGFSQFCFSFASAAKKNLELAWNRGVMPVAVFGGAGFTALKAAHFDFRGAIFLGLEFHELSDRWETLGFHRVL
jgi:hypothetical protein